MLLLTPSASIIHFKMRTYKNTASMLFNSYHFIFLFLPTTLLMHHGLRRHSTIAAQILLTMASLSFYALLDLPHLFVLILSALVNFGSGKILSRAAEKSEWLRTALLTWGIGFNLSLLAGYKYFSFISYTFGWPAFFPDSPIVPLGISFFSFHQIAYQVDIYRRRFQSAGFQDYLLFVTFFPHLIAGPIIRYQQFVPQLQQEKRYAWGAAVFFFSAGLCKKVVLADNLAPICDRIFLLAKQSGALPWDEAWKGALAYGLQIYFDFAGYAEMAIGIGLLFGIALPLNFASPYRAHSFIEFWRRWHITLSRFLQDYLYIPLGGNRHGQVRHGANLLFTMGLAGLWHGAGWTFVAWGTAHGVLLTVNHFWRSTVGQRLVFPRPLGIVITFTAVTLLWVLFRAESMQAALFFYQAMIPATPIETAWPPDASSWLTALQWREWLLVAGGLAVVFGLRTTAQWAEYHDEEPKKHPSRISFKHGLAAGAMLLIALKMMAGAPPRSFVYFVF